MLQTKRETEKEILHSLKEYGVNPSRNDAHRKFHQRAVSLALEYFQPAAVCSRFNKPCQEEQLLLKNQFPKEVVSAIDYVLRAELEDIDKDDCFSLAEDTLGMDYPPFHRVGDTAIYKRSWGFEKFSLRQLDPLARFTERSFSAPEYFRYIWNDRDSLAGTVFEAIVSCYVVFEKPCMNPHCMARNGLRWNGGRELSSSWADIICIQCGTTYEIKSKRNVQVVQKSFERNSFRGGSFRAYHLFPPEKTISKRYLVVVSREAEIKRGKKCKTYPVSIAEIEKVLPRLTGESFLGSQGKRIRIKSDIRVKLSTRELWCDIPICHAHHSEMAKDAFEKHFGTGKWEETASDEVTIEYPQAVSDDLKGQPEESLEDLKRSLDALKVRDGDGSDSDGDWEAIYADED